MLRAAQAKLLRALQNQEVQPVGSLQARKVNVRVVTATHRDLRVMIADGRFREDLFYRLSMVELQVPNLMEREGDLEQLTRFFVKKWAGQCGRELQGMTNRAMVVLHRHAWPGNVRELENAIGHAAMMTRGPMIDAADLPAYLLLGGATGSGAKLKSETEVDGGALDLPSLAEREKELVIGALENSGGNQSQAARLLKISRDQLRYRMKRHRLV